MEAKELMVGDLCCEWNNDHTEKHVVKVAQIQKEGVRDRYNVFHENDWIEPIPLTVEILEQNRWFEIFKDKYEGHISLAKEDTTCFRIKNTNLCLRFVHELQHALRLYILNEVADNLKV